MELLFSFHWYGKIAVVNLYKVTMVIEENRIELCEGNVDNPSTWFVYDKGDIALLRSWLIGNALGGEIFVEGRE
jgi:hypothetical protein